MKRILLFTLMILFLCSCNDRVEKIKIIPDIKCTVDFKDKIYIMVAEYDGYNNLSRYNELWNKVIVVNQTGRAHLDDDKLIPEKEGTIRLLAKRYDTKNTLIGDLSPEITIKKDLFATYRTLTQLSGLENVALGKEGTYFYGKKVREDFSLDSSVTGISYISSDKKDIVFSPFKTSIVREMHENENGELLLILAEQEGNVNFNKSKNTYTKTSETYDYEKILKSKNITVKYDADYYMSSGINKIYIENKGTRENLIDSNLTINGYYGCQNFIIYENKLVFTAIPFVKGYIACNYLAMFQIDLETMTIDWIKTREPNIYYDVNKDGIISCTKEQEIGIVGIEYQKINLN